VNAETLGRYADLVVGFAANIQPGQIVSLGSGPGKEELARAIAREAYRRGARFVDLAYFDSHVKRARIEHADPQTLGYVPPWYSERMLALGEHRAARIGIGPPVEPGLLDGLDPERAAQDRLPFIPELVEVVNDRTTNWTGGCCPIPSWARLVHSDLDPEAALERLWEQVVYVCRLDEDDPEAAWRERMATLGAVAERLTERRFDLIRFQGPGTDLRIGLLPSSTWVTVMFTTAEGIPHFANLPSEELFTTPDPERVDGIVRSTRPLALGGTVVRGLRVRFEGGHAAEIEADSGVEVVRAYCGTDSGAGRLGEVALVDGEGRIGPLGTVFYDTLLDENAASHVALGNAYLFTVEGADRRRANRSAIHVDFMIGSDEVRVTGVTEDGEKVPILRQGAWQI
jgi:aminopeptidase